MKTTAKSFRIGLAAASLGVIGLASVALGQTVQDTAVPDTGLNIPSNLQLFGKVDPNVRKPTAIVNDTVITGTDIDQRVALILSANGLQPSPEEMQQLRLRVLSSLVDETLQVQEARAHDIKVTSQEIDQGFARVARNFQKSPADLKLYLRQIGSSERSMRRQIEAELAWARYLRRRVEPFVNVGDEEVNSVLKRMEAAKGQTEYHLKEIYLRASPDRASQVVNQERGFIDEIRQGKRGFEDIAMTESEATTRAVGGDLGWLGASQLPDSLAQAAAIMEVNQIAGPIEVPGGFSIIFMADKRQVLTVDPRDSRLALRQISLPFKTGITQADAAAKVAEFGKMLQGIRGCGDVPRAAASLGAEVVDNDQVRVRDLPGPLQDLMLKLQPGEATPPFGSATDGVRALVLCSRDTPQEATMPGVEQMRNQMEQQAVNLRAEHKLRDLRRDAIIEYR